MHTLLDFRYKRSYSAAQRRARARRAAPRARAAKDLVIKVPPGTLVRDTETGRVLMDLYVPNEKKTLLRGGSGGNGNMPVCHAHAAGAAASPSPA